MDGDGTNVGVSPSFAITNAHDTHMEELSSLKQPLSGDSRDSVLAFVRFPQDNVWNRSCDGMQWQDVQIRMSYEKLMGLGSSKIRDMFSPRAQARFRRQFGSDPVPSGIDYFIDFTPPSEGPELADLTAALWLPRMVKLWFLAGQWVPDPILEAGADHGMGIPKRPLADKAVGPILSLGHDDVCKNIGCSTDMSTWQAKPDLPGIIDENPPFGQDHIPVFRRIEDYCPIRHRVAIVRVLRAINGDGLLLNSAVRMWTVAQVAIYLEVPQIVVDPVAQWLSAPPNTKFIEICPERAFQLAYNLKIPSVLIAAFRILVNEQAMDYASPEPFRHLPAFTWAQRRRDDYGDYPSDPVEYASRAFADRMAGKLAMLQSNNVFNRLPVQIPQWEMLQYLGTLIEPLSPCSLLHAYHGLVDALLAAFQGHINNTLKDFNHINRQFNDLLEAQRKHYISGFERDSMKIIYEKLPPSQKVITPFFWSCLPMSEHTSKKFASYHHNGMPLSAHAFIFNSALEAALTEKVIIPDPARSILVDYNSRLHSNLFTPPAIFDLPQFHSSLCTAIRTLSDDVHHNFANTNSDGIPYFLLDHLLLGALDEDTEFKYLPIWAEGLDDGSGGVYQEAIPPAEMGLGPGGPGPGFHTGYTVGTGTETDTETIGVGVLSLGSGTIARSLDVGRSESADTGGVGRVGKGVTAPSESFTEGRSVYGEARFAQPLGSEAGDDGMDGGGDGDDLGAGSDEEMVFFADSGSDDDDDDGDDDTSTLDGVEKVDAEDTGDATNADVTAAGARCG